jgi:hypothetical protein
MRQLNYSIKYKPIIITSFVAQLAAYLYNWFSSPAGHLFAAMLIGLVYVIISTLGMKTFTESKLNVSCLYLNQV